MIIPLPPLKIDDCAVLRENYTVYAALSNIGAAFIKMTSGCEKTGKLLKKSLGRLYSDALQIARCFIKYRLAVDLCDSTVSGQFSVDDGNEELFTFAARCLRLNLIQARGRDFLEL